MVPTKEDKKLLLEYLASQRLMSIATYGDKPWIATVYYVNDNDLNLYFLSSPKTQHCQDIAKNKNVVCTIFNSNQEVTDKKVGLQIRGGANIVNVIDKIKWMLKLWHKNNPGMDNIINLKNMQNKVIEAKVYKVASRKIKFFNEKFYGPEGEKVFLL